VHVLVLTIEW